jgi:hypothetical protein
VGWGQRAHRDDVGHEERAAGGRHEHARREGRRAATREIAREAAGQAREARCGARARPACAVARAHVLDQRRARPPHEARHERLLQSMQRALLRG